MYQHKKSSFFVAAVISITAHAAAVVYFGHYDVPSADKPQSAVSVMRISLAPTRPAALKPPAEPETRPEPPPPPRRKPAPRPEVKQKSLAEPVIKPLPPPDGFLETAELIEEQNATSAYAKASIDKPALARVALEDERESYLLRLLAHIDKHKFYPRRARQRGMEGEIRIAFHLLRDGSISGLQVTGGSKLLRKAARQAVQQAVSLPLPPDSIRLQEQIRFGMVYRLDG